jgi:hypothetical protein
VSARSWAALPQAIGGEMQPRTELTVSEWADSVPHDPAGHVARAGRLAHRPRAVPARDPRRGLGSDRRAHHVQAASQVGEVGDPAQRHRLLRAPGAVADPARAVDRARHARLLEGARRADVRRVAGAARQARRGRARSEQHDHAAAVPRRLLACAWAGSAASLASRPIRIVLGDELDRWPDTTGRDGDPWAQAVQRASQLPQPQDPRGVDADGRELLGDRAPVRRQRPAALPRAVPALRRRTRCSSGRA